jgi:hypothetical protein
MLDPQTISQVFTLAEIDAEITSLLTIYRNALKNKSYSLDDMQSRQKVEQHDIKQISDELNVWLRAKAILTGQSSTKLLSIDYTGSHN